MKVFSPFLKGDTTTSGSLNVPQHPTSASIQNPTTGSLYNDTTDNVLKIYTGTQWQVVGEQAFVEAVASADIEYLLVAGGGGAGMLAGGGGGAGGLLSSSLASVESGSSFTVTIGGGGAGATVDGGNGIAGVDSSIAGTTITTLTSIGGGLGPHGTAGGSGGSGGGGGYFNASSIGGSGTVGQGNDGGAGGLGSDSTTYPCGGGGGAGTAGSDAISQGLGGDGGDGKQSSITGTSTYYAGGGGGSGGTTPGTGGQGGGGNGGQIFSGTTAQSGTPNTGGGGGGGRTPAGSGGSGVAIFAYDSGSINAAGGIVGDAGNGRKYNQFNTSGTFKVGSTSDFGIVTDSLVSHYDAGDFNSRGTSTWTDLSGNSYNLTATSSPSLGNNFYYDFSTSYFTRTDSAHEFSDNNFTVEVWVKFDSLSSGDTIASKRGTGNPGTRNWLFGHDSSGLVYFLKYHSSSQTTYPQTGTGVITTGTWYHLVATGDATNLKVYVDGVEEATTAFTTTGVYGTGSPLELARRGTNSGYQYLDGQIAQFRAYSSGLTAAEVLQNYNATKTNFV